MLKRLGSLIALSLSFAVVLCGLGATGASAQGAVTDAPEVAARLLELVNAERAAAGLPALVARDDVAAIAGPHSAQMAAAHDIWHNDAYFTSATRSKLNAKGLGENVGKNATAEAAHRAFMDSPGHRANVMNASFTVAGFGAARDEKGYLYVTENFVTPNGAKAAPAPAAPAPAAPAPAPTAPVAKSAPVAKAAPVVTAQAPVAKAAPAPAPVAAPAPAPEVTVPPAPTTTEAPAVGLPANVATAPAPGFSVTAMGPVLAGLAVALVIGAIATTLVRRSPAARV